jgi:hypothetical protein
LTLKLGGQQRLPDMLSRASSLPSRRGQASPPREQIAAKKASSRQGDENEVNSRAKQHGQVGQRKDNRYWWPLQNIGEASSSVAGSKVPTASMTKIITQY